jgi:hypothetical protein
MKEANPKLPLLAQPNSSLSPFPSGPPLPFLPRGPSPGPFSPAPACPLSLLCLPHRAHLPALVPPPKSLVRFPLSLSDPLGPPASFPVVPPLLLFSPAQRPPRSPVTTGSSPPQPYPETPGLTLLIPLRHPWTTSSQQRRPQNPDRGRCLAPAWSRASPPRAHRSAVAPPPETSAGAPPKCQG